jgi:Na+-transporting methylmalonyl-CoA/oxaloacetate decarboxylase gamma subunit
VTVQLDKKQIHLGWETAGAILIFLVVTIYGFGSFVTKFLEKQNKIYTIVVKLDKKDSTQDNNIAVLNTYQAVNTSDITNIKNDIQDLKNQKNNRSQEVTHYYTEKWKNGHLYLISVK